jgi:hypothetical protein
VATGPTAISQPTISTDALPPDTMPAMRSPILVALRVRLNPPPAATMSRMPAIGGSDCSSDVQIAFAFMPAPRPRVNVAALSEVVAEVLSGRTEHGLMPPRPEPAAVA